MASITPYPSSKDQRGWIVHIKKRGHRRVSKVFPTLSQAKAWAADIESKMNRSEFSANKESESILFGDVVQKYIETVLPFFRGAEHERHRFEKIKAELGFHTLRTLTPEILDGYRDARLKEVSPQTVVHELNAISRVYTACRRRLRIPAPPNPVRDVVKPDVPQGRNRLVSDIERRYIIEALTNPGGRNPNKEALPLFLLASETAGRLSEVLSMQWHELDLDRHVARIRGIDFGKTKNNDPYRDVPLSEEAESALRLLLPAGKKIARGPVFKETGNSIQCAWARALKRARKAYVNDLLRDYFPSIGLDAESEIRAITYKKRVPDKRTLKELREIEKYDKTLIGIRIHDLRHQATSQMAKVFEMHELMKVTGHKTAKMVMRYYHPDIPDLAKKLRESKANRRGEVADN